MDDKKPRKLTPAQARDVSRKAGSVAKAINASEQSVVEIHALARSKRVELETKREKILEGIRRFGPDPRLIAARDENEQFIARLRILEARSGKINLKELEKQKKQIQDILAETAAMDTQPSDRAPRTKSK